ncbi:MAG: EAL domain-containing protein, partial [Sphingomonadaceae bacterium]|nr:EAL domain-containing protein [Sphingomonadaceae bacterium]
GELIAALEASEERQKLVLRATNDVIWEWSHATDRVQWSDAVETVLGYPEARQGTTIQWFFDRLHPGDVEAALAIYKQIRTVDQPYWNDEYRVRHADGHYVPMFARGYVVRDAAGVAQRSVGALLDVSAQKQIENELRWAAHHDPLTKLPNRLLFGERLAEALDEARRGGGGVGLSVIDLDDFKMLNDGRGHAAGDALLCEVARRLVEQVPAGATVARLGGDEFAVIFPRLQPGDTRPETLEKILVAMGDPLMIDGRRAAICLSAGAAVWPQDGATAEDLLKSADLALYVAKAAGPNAIRAFTPEMRDAAERQKRMLADARRALEQRRIFPFYQPKVCLRTGRLLGFEALLRWHDPENGTMGPSAIQAAFADTELSFQLTDRMLEHVVADMRRWSDIGLAYGRIAVNGSTVDFLRGDFPQRILDHLREAGLAASQLELEVTETVLLGQLASNVERALRTLSAAGVSIALDDFGTGYASLTHLKQFPVDSLKIDRS